MTENRRHIIVKTRFKTTEDNTKEACDSFFFYLVVNKHKLQIFCAEEHVGGETPWLVSQ